VARALIVVVPVSVPDAGSQLTEIWYLATS
jgi:hypothetical protein